MKFIKLLILVLVTTGFTAHSVIAEEASNTVARKQIVELLPQDFKPAFTRETVIKLNAIVHRSFDAINEYDSNIRDFRKAVEEGTKSDASEEVMEMTKKKLAHLNTLMAKSKSALADMMAAKTELENSDEEYNKAILAGMVDFVEDVEREISAQNIKLHAMVKTTES